MCKIGCSHAFCQTQMAVRDPKSTWVSRANVALHGSHSAGLRLCEAALPKRERASPRGSATPDITHIVREGGCRIAGTAGTIQSVCKEPVHLREPARIVFWLRLGLAAIEYAVFNCDGVCGCLHLQGKFRSIDLCAFARLIWVFVAAAIALLRFVASWTSQCHCLGSILKHRRVDVACALPQGKCYDGSSVVVRQHESCSRGL